MHGKETYINSFIISISMLKTISFLMKYNDNKKLKNCDITVAKAAPFTDNFNTYTNKKSNIILVIETIIIKHNDTFSFPLDFITDDIELYKNIKNTPEKIILIYS